MKLKNLYPLLIVAAFVAMVMDSCSPTPTGVEDTKLNPNKTGKRMGIKDSNTYDYALSCGCEFELKVENSDQTSIRYDFGNITTPSTSHLIKAFPRPGLTTGTYYGWAAVVTLKPDTNPDLRDTLRDTVVVP
jgi:hypothetical protein